MNMTDLIVLKSSVDYDQDYESYARGCSFAHTAKIQKKLYMKARTDFVEDLDSAKVMKLRTALQHYGDLIHTGKVTVHLVTLTQGDDITDMVKK